MTRAVKRTPRTRLYVAAWILFAAAALLSRGSPIADAVGLARQLRVGVAAFRFAGICLFVLCAFSNIVFLATLLIRNAARITIGWRVLLTGSIAANAALLIFFPRYAGQITYWLWLFAFVVAASSLLALPAGPPSAPRKVKRAAADEEVPGLIWAWLACAVFWIGVMIASYLLPPPAAATAPPLPSAAARLTTFFEDRAAALPAADVARLNAALAQFERETSDQLAVVVYPSCADGAIEDFTIRAAERWKVGRSGRDNGAILFVFLKERVARLEVGYGLEGALPDAIARRILDQQLAPNVLRGDLGTGIDAAARAVMSRIRSEYSGGRAPGLFRTTLARLSRLGTTTLPLVWPFLRDSTIDQRIGISFFATLLGFGISSGFANAGRVIRNLARAAANVAARRPIGSGMVAVELTSVFDTVKLIGILLVPLAGIVVLIAGGGAFGGAGASVHW